MSKAKTPEHCETKWSARWIILFVGVYGLLSLVGSFGMFLYLASKGKPIPVEQVPMLMALSAAGGGCMTGLLGLLGRTSQDPPAGTPANPTSTVITNSPQDPAQVEVAKP